MWRTSDQSSGRSTRAGLVQHRTLTTISLSRGSKGVKRIAQPTIDEKTMINEIKTETADINVGLTCNQDVSMKIISFCKQPFLAGAANPFPEETPTKILSRQYRIADLVVDPSFTGYRVNFPQALFQVPAIAKALSSFYYFHADLQVMVKINATPYHQGALMVSFVHDAPDTLALSTAQLSVYSPVMMNYATSDAVTLNYSWMCPELYSTTVYTGGPHAIGSLFLAPIAPVVNISSANDSISVTIYASFKEPKTAGFINDPIVLQSGTQDKFAPTQEAENKSASGLVTARGAVSLLSPIFRSIPIVGQVYDTIAAVAKNLSSIMDKPRDLTKAMKMVPDYTVPMCNGTGIDDSSRLSLYPASALKTKGVFPHDCHTTNMSFVELASTPMLHYQQVLSETTPSFELVVDPMFLGTYNILDPGVTIQPDYMMYLFSMHKFWRGSIKYFIIFNTSAFVTARIRVSYAINPTETNFGYGGDFPSRVIEIQGTTQCTFIAPYLAPTPYRPVLEPFTDITTGPPKINISLLTLPVASQGSDPFITATVFRGGGPDMQFVNLQQSTITLQCDVQKEFKNKFEPLACDCTLSFEDGYTTAETSMFLIDAMRRYSPAASNVFPIYNNLDDLDNGFNDWRTPYCLISTMFKYWRGSYRKKYLLNQTATSWDGVSQTFLGGFNAYGAALYTPASHAPQLTVEMPYQAAHPYLAQEDNSYAIPYENEVPTLNVPGTVQVSLISAGEDFVMGYLTHPRAFHKEPTRSKLITPGL